MLVDINIIMRIFMKIHIPNVYKKGENDHNSRCPSKSCVNSLFSSLFLLVKSFEDKIQPSRDCVNTARG